jgi:hypothetical protein
MNDEQPSLLPPPDEQEARRQADTLHTLTWLMRRAQKAYYHSKAADPNRRDLLQRALSLEARVDAQLKAMPPPPAIRAEQAEDTDV